ncbi:hypothetical protein LINGRAHAP2_LOCUS6216 [Linum grandiflorum]
MADHNFFNHGGNQDKYPARTNQRLDSNPFQLLDGWTAPEDSCQQLLFPSCKVEEVQYQLSDHGEDHNKISALSELDQMIHRKSNPDTPSGLFGLLASGPRKQNISTSTSATSTVYETSNVAASAGLSTEDIFRIAGARFIQSYSKSGDLVPNPFDISFSGLSDKQLRNVELAEFLLTAAEKVGDGQLERASNLLTGCELQSSPTGDPVQ